MERHALTLVLLVTLVGLSSGAGPHLERGVIVADNSEDRGVMVLLYVQGGYGDAQSVYSVRPVARCLDPSGPGWYALPSIGALRSAPRLESCRRLGALEPDRLPSTCAARALVEGQAVQRESGWDRLVEGALLAFGQFT